jgi:hypothetical protein
MKIETKFNVGDEVWYMNNNLPSKRAVKAISIFRTKNDVRIKYLWDEYSDKEYVVERLAFASKEELLASL